MKTQLAPASGSATPVNLAGCRAEPETICNGCGQKRVVYVLCIWPSVHVIWVPCRMDVALSSELELEHTRLLLGKLLIVLEPAFFAKAPFGHLNDGCLHGLVPDSVLVTLGGGGGFRPSFGSADAATCNKACAYTICVTPGRVDVSVLPKWVPFGCFVRGSVRVQVGHRIIRKRIHVRTEHVVPSRCREAFVKRCKANDAAKHEAHVNKSKPLQQATRAAQHCLQPRS